MNLETFLYDVAGLTPPSRTGALRMMLAGTDEDLLDPRETAGLHPLVVPLSRDAAGHTLGFLRWPTAPDGLQAPLVRQQGAGGGVVLVARSLDEWLHRELATRDARDDDDPGALLVAANRPGTLYSPGDVAVSGLPLPAYLLLKAGVSLAFFEELIEAHLERGDQAAALVTADRALSYAPGFARPHAVRARLYERLGRVEEARDAARVGLLEPIWTLGEPLAPTAVLAAWTPPITGAPFRALADDVRKLPADRAAHLMDAVAADESGWDAVRPALAALYREAGLDAVAALVGR